MNIRNNMCLVGWDMDGANVVSAKLMERFVSLAKSWKMTYKHEAAAMDLEAMIRVSSTYYTVVGVGV